MKIAIIVLIALFLGVAGFFYWLGTSESAPVPSPIQQQVSTQGHIQ